MKRNDIKNAYDQMAPSPYAKDRMLEKILDRSVEVKMGHSQIYEKIPETRWWTIIPAVLAVLVLEFIVPLLLGNGATVGKKVFSLGLIRTDGVKINTMQLFVRALLGKFTIETMIPLYLFLMMLWGLMGIAGTVIICGLGITQMLLYGFTRTNSLLHDLLAGTVVVDISSQRVFASTDDLIEYTKRVHAEKAERQDY